jgi:hypothetical protein
VRPVLVLATVLLVARPTWADPHFPAGHSARLCARSGTGVFRAVPWSPPSETHRLGTLLVGANRDGAGPAVSEWDLAGVKVLRRVGLGLGDKWRDVALATDGMGGVHVLVNGPPAEPFRYFALDADLRLLRSAPIATGLSATVRADRSNVVIEWLDTFGPAHVAILDPATGRLRTTKSFPSGAGSAADLPASLEIAGGRIFAVIPNYRRSSVLWLDPVDLHVVRAYDVEDPWPEVAPAGDHIVVWTATELIELTPELKEARRRGLPRSTSTQLAYDAARGAFLTSAGALEEHGSFEVRFDVRGMGMQALWTFGTPVVLTTDEEGFAARIAWLDAGRPTRKDDLPCGFPR